MQEGITAGKVHYWKYFTQKRGIWGGFAGGFTIERSVKRYLKKIRKKRFYISERRYAKVLLFLKGAFYRNYRLFSTKIGRNHLNLIDETFQLALDVAKKEGIEK